MNSFRLIVDEFHWSDQRFAIQVGKVEGHLKGLNKLKSFLNEHTGLVFVVVAVLLWTEMTWDQDDLRPRSFGTDLNSDRVDRYLPTEPHMRLQHSRTDTNHQKPDKRFMLKCKCLYCFQINRDI